ncbi:MAG: LysR substrate-binding domain-containing protein [Maritimibacter sp.]
MDLTLKQLSYFLALTRTRHFGRAAQETFVTQPALSTQIRELEDRIGATLIDRSSRAFRLTPAGQEVRAAAFRIMGEVERIKTTARWQNGLQGHLKLGIIPTVAPYVLPEFLPDLRMRDVTLDLSLTEAKTERILTLLMDGEIDAALIALPSGAPGLIEEPLFQDRFFLANRRAEHGAAQGQPARPAPSDLNPETLLLLDEGHCLADQALAVCGMRRSATKVDLRASSLPTLCGLVAAGFGQTLLPEIALPAETAAAPNLEITRFCAPEPARTIGLVRRDLGGPDGWFMDLAMLLKRAAARLKTHAVPS